jgi:hypothetical protein
MPRSVMTLGGVAARLDVRSDRCDRQGRLRLDRLLVEHGPQTPV